MTWLPEMAQSLMESGRAVTLYDLLVDLDALEYLSAEDLRDLTETLRAQGYLQRALSVAKELDRRGRPQHQVFRKMIQPDLDVLAGEVEAVPAPLSKPYVPRRGMVLYVVEGSFPKLDSKDTRRAQQFAQPGSRPRLDAEVVAQVGQCDPAGYDVNYHRIPGPARGTIGSDKWLKIFKKRLSVMVRKARPAVVVASFDVLKGMVARAIGAKYGITFVYHVRNLKAEFGLDRRGALALR